MRCPKCGGRTTKDDVHTYLGHEVELKCLMCGRRFPLMSSQIEQQTKEKEEVNMPAVRATCIDCKRPDMAIQAHGRCGKCHYAAVKNGTVTVIPRKPKLDTTAPPVPPPADPVPPAAPAEPTILPAAVVQDRELVQVTFDERDDKLFRQLEESARYNRRTLAAEILFRLDRTFDAA